MEIFNFEACSRLLAAVSGGRDSMVMLRLLWQDSLVKHYDLEVLTINHGIRPEAQADALFVALECSKLGIPCYIERVDVPTYAQNNKLSIETAARILRRQLFDKYAPDYNFICLAHHKGDQAETVLMHILRGCGLSGARGMRIIEGKLARPLLHASSAEIEQYAKQEGVPYVTDSTNLQTDYTRNFLRLEVMPRLKQRINEQAEDALCAFAQRMAETETYLNDLARSIPIKPDRNGLVVSVHELTKHPKVVRIQLYINALNQLSALTDLLKVHLDSVDNLVVSSSNESRQVQLPNGYVVLREFDCVRFFKRELEKEVQAIPFNPCPCAHSLSFADTLLTVSEAPPSEGDCLKIDANKLPFGCVIRTRKEGDRFHRFGGFDKKLKEFFIERKIPLSKRDSLPLLAKNDRVYVVFGYEIADCLKVTPDSKQVLYLSCQPATPPK